MLLIVVVIAATFFLSKDFREYLRDYEPFQEHKEYIQALEKVENPDGIGNGEDIGGDGNGTENQFGVSDNQPAASDNPGERIQIPLYSRRIQVEKVVGFLVRHYRVPEKLLM